MGRGVLDLIGNTPLLPLAQVARDLPVPVLVKCEHLNPGGSVKDRIALAMVEDAEARGLLEPGATLIEATAGNTGLSLAMVAAVRGYRLVCVMPDVMSPDKRDALRALGAKLVLTPAVPFTDPRNFRQHAARLGEANGWFNTDQFNNPANVRVHEERTAEELLRQTDGKIGTFVCAAGSGGTLSGVGRRLKAKLPGVRVVLADPVGSAFASFVETGTAHPGAGAAPEVEGVGGLTPPTNLIRDVIDGAERVFDSESFAMVGRLIHEEGLWVGGSSGTNVAAACQLAARGFPGPIVTILPDAWDRYRGLAWMKELRSQRR